MNLSDADRLDAGDSAVLVAGRAGTGAIHELVSVGAGSQYARERRIVEQGSESITQRIPVRAGQPRARAEQQPASTSSARYHVPHFCYGTEPGCQSPPASRSPSRSASPAVTHSTRTSDPDPRSARPESIRRAARR